MRRHLARQLVQLVIVIIGISLMSFAILHVLGDPVLLLLPQNAGHEEFERYRKLLGLDQLQVEGDLGEEGRVFHEPVTILARGRGRVRANGRASS